MGKPKFKFSEVNEETLEEKKRKEMGSNRRYSYTSSTCNSNSLCVGN